MPQRSMIAPSVDRVAQTSLENPSPPFDIVDTRSFFDPQCTPSVHTLLTACQTYSIACFYVYVCICIGLCITRICIMHRWSLSLRMHVTRYIEIVGSRLAVEHRNVPWQTVATRAVFSALNGSQEGRFVLAPPPVRGQLDSTDSYVL